MQLMQELFRNLYELEPLQEAWGLWLPKAEALLYHNSDMAYEEWRTEFAAYMESEEFSQDQNMSLAIMQEHLVVYFLFSYFCGAVYDEYVYALAQEAVVNAWLIQDLWMAKWLEQGKTLSLEEVIHITYQYSRELEHSDDNLVCMEELMDQNPIVESWYN